MVAIYISLPATTALCNNTPLITGEEAGCGAGGGGLNRAGFGKFTM
jgi:hypothetical protein